MNRRDFIAGTATLLVSSRTSRAEGPPRRIGYLDSVLKELPRYKVWLDSLRDHGWVEGKNLIIDYRSIEGRAERIPPLANELVALKPDVLVGVSPQIALALKSETATIPIVFIAVFDPVAIGLVQSLSRPGGNITGLATYAPGDWIGKRIEILRELVPSASKIALLVNPRNPIHRLVLANEVSSTARSMGVALPIVEATTADELDTAFASAAAQQADAMIVFSDNLTGQEAPRVTALAANHHLPAIYLFGQIATGELIVYGPDIADLLRRAGGYVDKILKGTKPADLPVEQPTRFELTINMKTAKALGLTVPPSLLVRADEVIE
ncbi:ABC transporter substrate-binding protein [Bradyrhizobium manausense]|uniref:ABC transporter substrate-binding protein n=1 Tax=Bradyrhizobium TaxID=374 RepID=UPI001BA55D43|nr:MULTISPECIES: ABC transporter substrate-binding protein [Bradyrhizobium]MBR0828905.1 ABC transporter substrate-binding protein [Bradyrhizobium manausense]UVO28088.1 ABC transporter substrate-binding protein [Bradyrhizobium arachidis]